MRSVAHRIVSISRALKAIFAAGTADSAQGVAPYYEELKLGPVLNAPQLSNRD